MNLSLQKADQWLPEDRRKLGGEIVRGFKNFEGD